MKQKFVCPACSHEVDWLSALRDKEQRDFIARLIREVGDKRLSTVMRYLAMFKPRKNAQSFGSINNRLDSLMALITSTKVTRNGITKIAPPAVWYGCMDDLVVNKPATLELPLRSHNYLSQMVWSQAEKAQEDQELEHIRNLQNREQHQQAGEEGFKNLKNIIKGVSS